MCIGKGHALLASLSICGVLILPFGVEALYISVAQVITHDQNNIGAVVAANGRQKYGRKDCE